MYVLVVNIYSRSILAIFENTDSCKLLASTSLLSPCSTSTSSALDPEPTGPSPHYSSNEWKWMTYGLRYGFEPRRWFFHGFSFLLFPLPNPQEPLRKLWLLRFFFLNKIQELSWVRMARAGVHLERQKISHNNEWRLY